MRFTLDQQRRLRTASRSRIHADGVELRRRQAGAGHGLQLAGRRHRGAHRRRRRLHERWVTACLGSGCCRSGKPWIRFDPGGCRQFGAFGSPSADDARRRDSTSSRSSPATSRRRRRHGRPGATRPTTGRRSTLPAATSARRSVTCRSTCGSTTRTGSSRCETRSIAGFRRAFRNGSVSMTMEVTDFDVPVDVRPRRPTRSSTSATSACLGGIGDLRRRYLMDMDAVELSVGWGVLHLFYSVDRDARRGRPAGRQARARRGAVARGRRPPGAAVRGARPQGRPRGDGARARPRPAPGVPARAVDRAAHPRRLLRVAHRAVGVHVHRRRRARAPRGGGGSRRRGAGGVARRLARAHGALPASSACTRSCR